MRKFLFWLIFTGIILSGIILLFPNFSVIKNDSLEKASTQEKLPKKRTSLLKSLLSQDSEPSPTPALPPPPTSKILPGGRHTFQTFNNCGPSSLSMALSYYEQDVSQQILGNQLRPYQRSNGDNDDKSVTLAELAQLATEYGLTSYHRPAGDMKLVQQFIAHDIPVITRTWLKPNEDIGHYRVIKGYDSSRNTLIQDDSLQGKNLEYSYAEFNELWQAFNYEFLVLIPAEKKEIALQILGERVDVEIAWQQAYELAQSQLKKDPNDIYAQFNQVVSLYYLEKYEEAITLYERISNDLPKRMLWYQIEPILAYFQTGNYTKVLEISENIFNSQNRAFSELHWLRGKVFEASGEKEKAQEEFSLATEYNTSKYWKINIQ